jgi:DNA-directed RNA polymerase subunit RPC12/RpoP
LLVLPKYEMFAWMSEFKYACPVCGQHIKCDSSQAGTVMTCPTCFQKITVPNAPATEDQKFIITGTKVGNERPIPRAVEPAADVPRATGISGTAVVVIILAFICGVAATIYYETIFKDVHRQAKQTPLQTTAAPLAPVVAAPPPGPPDLALHLPASASSQEPQHPASAGNDGDIHTRWAAASRSVPQWWTVDFSNSVVVTNIEIVWEHNAAYQYLIESSLNNSNWTVVADHSTNVISTNVMQGKTTSDDFSAQGRYFRVVVTGLPGKSRASFSEFRLFGSTNGQ